MFYGSSAYFETEILQIELVLFDGVINHYEYSINCVLFLKLFTSALDVWYARLYVPFSKDNLNLCFFFSTSKLEFYVGESCLLFTWQIMCQRNGPNFRGNSLYGWNSLNFNQMNGTNIALSQINRKGLMKNATAYIEQVCAHRKYKF